MENTKHENFKKRMEEIYLFIEEKISLIPENLRKPLQKELDIMKKLIIEARAPRFAIVGRRGAGKSSILNAIFGSPVAKIGSVKAETQLGKWFPFSDKKGSMEILDTRGLNEGLDPQKAMSDLKSCLNEKLPDAFIFLNKAKEVDAHINADINSLKELYDYVKEEYSYNIPIITVASQVDELDPKSDHIPPFKEQKLKNIETATTHLNDYVNKVIPNSSYKIGISSYLEFDENNKITFDSRWNIDKLIELLIEHIPQSAQLELAKIGQMKSIQKKMARKIVITASTICSTIALEPLPFADLPIITGIQISMIIAIGYLAGYEMNKETAMEFLAAMGINVGSAFVFREIAKALVKLIPGFGSGISAGIAFAGTYSIGEAATAYFIDKKSKDETKLTYDKEFNKLKDKK